MTGRQKGLLPSSSLSDRMASQIYSSDGRAADGISENDKRFVFITNHVKLPALTIAQLDLFREHPCFRGTHGHADDRFH